MHAVVVKVNIGEESARSAAEMIQGPEAMRPETVTLESVEVREVVANA
jgi:hypothetical protein